MILSTLTFMSLIIGQMLVLIKKPYKLILVPIIMLHETALPLGITSGVYYWVSMFDADGVSAAEWYFEVSYHIPVALLLIDVIAS